MDTAQKINVNLMIYASIFIGLLLMCASGLALGQTTLSSSEPMARYGLQQNDLKFSLGVIHSDNMGRDEFERSGFISTAGLSANLVGESRRLGWNVKGLVDYRQYSDDLYQDEPIGNIGGGAAVDLVKDRLTLDLSGNFGQLRRNAFEAENSENRENVYSIDMGPSLTLPLSGVTSFSARGRLGQRGSGEGSLDGDISSVETGVFRYLDPLRHLGLFVSKRKVEFGKAPTSNYEVESAFFRYSQELRAGSITVELGNNELQRDGGASDSGLFSRFNARTRVGKRSEINFYAIADFQDSAYSMRDGLDPVELASGRRGALTSDPVERRGFGLQALIGLDRLTIIVAADASSDSYETSQELDRDGWTYRVSLARELLPDVRAGIEVAQRYEDYQSDVEAGKEQWARIFAVYRVSRTLYLETALRRWNREGGQSSVKDLGETEVSLSLQFVPRSSRG